MTIPEAKAVLILYRPGSADSDDPAFTDALRLCESDAELRQWFERHCDTYSVIRGKMQQQRAPEGFKEQILAERPRPVEKPKRAFDVKRAGIGVLALATIAMALFLLRPQSEDKSLAGFQHRMVSTALRSYGMDFQSENPERIRSYLADQKAISDYVLPTGLQSLKPLGCLATSWQGKPVTMICYRTGKALPAGQVSDLWLFVAEVSAVRGSPKTTVPAFTTVNRAAAATWTENGKIYVLAVDGDLETLRRYL